MKLNEQELEDYKIVHIFENPYFQKRIQGYLEEYEPGKYFFIPLVKHLPKLKVMKFSENLKSYIQDFSIDIKTQYLVGIIQDHQQNKFYRDVEIVELYGPQGDVQVESNIILDKQEIYREDFKPQTYEYLTLLRKQIDSQGNFVIGKSQREKRWDLTKEIIFSIDPEDAKDLDDALSIKKISNDKYEVGVHIADVSYFVPENSILDEEARLRTLTIYLVQKAIPMLPHILCENLCSLNPNQERFAFSVFFYLNENGELVNEEDIRFGRSIINSCNKFSYSIVQQIYEGKIKSPKQLPNINKARKDIDEEKMFETIQMLIKMGLNRRKTRQEKTFLFFKKSVKKFVIDKETLLPIKLQNNQATEANQVVEEFMLLANILVAKKISSVLPQISLLRYHQQEREATKIKQFLDVMYKFDHQNFDLENIYTIVESLQNIYNDPNISPLQQKFIDSQLFQLISQAQYFITGNKPQSMWYHFALNVPEYTHFTSPIRRYPDIIVHRILNYILEYGNEAYQHINVSSIIQIIEKCNQCKQKQKVVGTLSEKLYMLLYLKDKQIASNALAYQIDRHKITFFINELNISHSVEWRTLKSIQAIQYKKLQKRNQINITFQNENMQQSDFVILNEMDEFKVRIINNGEIPMDYKIDIMFPIQKGDQLEYVIIQ